MAAPVRGETVTEALAEILVTGGQAVGTAFDDSTKICIIPRSDPEAPLGWSNHVGPLGAIYVNVGQMEALLNWINATFGTSLTTSNPEILGLLLWVCLHELGHVNCCHKDGDNKPGSAEWACDQVMADVRGAYLGCDLIIAVQQSGGPADEDQARMLHALCAKIKETIDEINGSPTVIATCLSLVFDGYSPCRCTSSSWSPPRSDPCEDCPGVPVPGTPGNPYPIPQCDACDHI